MLAHRNPCHATISLTNVTAISKLANTNLAEAAGLRLCFTKEWGHKCKAIGLLVKGAPALAHDPAGPATQ